MELVVGPQGWQSTHADTVGKEDLSGSVDPNFAVLQFVEVDCHVIPEPLHGALKRHSADQKDGHHEVRKQGSEPNNLEKNNNVEVVLGFKYSCSY